jgi:Uma2 family endonuclease
MATAIATSPVTQHFALSSIPWQAYVGIGDLMGEQPVRLTYARGTLELMTLSREHELLKSLLRRFVEIVAEETGIELASGGSTTFRRQDLERGLESDECYWIAHQAEVFGREQIDLTVDPPPDLALEIEISRNLLDRMAIYAALRVPEVWRYDGQALSVLWLGEDGQYAAASSSLSFPFLPMAELERHLALRGTVGEMALARQFRSWVRTQIAAGAWPRQP